MTTQKCTALNLSDESRCHEEATSASGLFCAFHNRQCYGLYRGYKIRNAKLDGLDRSPPTYLAESDKPLRNETFAAVEDEETLNALHSFLFKKHALLDRVIRARKLHHSRFYSLNLDYGHKAYLDKLINDKFVVLRALERLERRTTEVLYAQRKWFKWVRERQDEEEAARVKESEMVKKEAKLFKRHWKEVEARLKEKRRKEDEGRQAAFLEDAYQKRLKQLSEEEAEEAWDPIEDAVEDERGSFVDLMKKLLWLGGALERSPESAGFDGPSDLNGHLTIATPAPGAGKENVDPNKGLSRNAKKRTKAKAKVDTAETIEAAKVDVNETREEMCDRLVSGVRYDAGEGIKGEMVYGTVENPTETMGKVPGMPRDEAEKILDEVAEIKLFLFCRLLLSQAAMLPAALKAESVEEFLGDPEVATADLRELCLRVEQPSLQEIRDACADFFRGDEEEGEEESSTDEEVLEENNDKKLRRKDLPDTWRSRHEKEVDSRKKAFHDLTKETHTAIDFGEIEDEQFKNKTVRVKVCGKTIWNYPSNEAMVRGGWLHYSIIAKGSKLNDAIELCRNWDEFWELNVLAIFQYFPAPHWGQWSGGRLRQQLLQLGIIPYLQFEQAEQTTVNHKVGGSRGQGPHFRASFQCRNVIGAHIKRNDSVSRRFVQYLAMQSGKVVLLVRDAKTGRILVEPPEEHTWLVRKMSGYGRSAHIDWTVIRSVDENLFEEISGQKMRDWQFGFTEYFDVIVWDLQAGMPFSSLYSTVQEAMIKALRCCTVTDMYSLVAPTMKTLKRDRESFRVSDALPMEETLWDEIHHDGSKIMFGKVAQGRHVGFIEEAPPDWFYGDIDAAEDMVLFPEEVQGAVSTKIVDRPDGTITELERRGPNWKRFVLDLDSDQDSDDYEDVDLSGPRAPKKSKPKEKKKSDIRKEIKASSERHRRIVAANGDPQKLPLRQRKKIAGPQDLEQAQEQSSSTVAENRDLDCTCDMCLHGEYAQCEAWENEELEDEDAVMDFDEQVEETLRLVKALAEIAPSNQWGDDPEADFWRYLDREKSKLFKKAWHDAVIDPDERAEYQAANGLIEDLSPVEGTMSKDETNFCLNISLWLRVHLYEHRLVWKDLARAYGAMSIFFNAKLQQENPYYSTLTATARTRIADNAGRAKRKPYDRTFQSNMTVSKSFWNDVDALYERQREDRKRDPDSYNYNRKWDETIRPLVAHWFKAGVIGPAYLPYPPGFCTVLAEPTKEPDVYFDFRATREAWPTRSDGLQKITDPNTVDLLQPARNWRNANPRARFALLRIWTHSHFYPLMLGHDNRDMTSFVDAIGRSWEWKFVPKDMAGSEWSIQKGVDLRIDPFRKQFRGQVIVKRDTVLVMGKNEGDLKKFAVAVTFAIQTNPWRLEVDLWKSFVNVDLEFLEGLDAAWLE